MKRERLRTTLFLVVAAGSILLTIALYFAPSWKPVRSAFESTADLDTSFASVAQTETLADK